MKASIPLILFFLALLSSGCGLRAHTTHDYCMNNLEHYRDYEECYQEQELAKMRRRNSFSHMGDGLQNASKQAQTQSCVLNRDASGSLIGQCR
jgi:hypothetical protein